MLQAMRTGAKSILIKTFLFGLLLLAMGGLALMDVQGMFRSGISSTTVAKIGSEKITSFEFGRLVDTALREQKIPRNEAYQAGIPRQILEQEINSRMFTKAARDLGIAIDDATVAQQIKTMLAPLVQGGMTEKEALDRLLSHFGITEKKLVSTIKAQMATDNLTDMITNGAFVPRQLVQDALRFRYEWRNGEYFRITAADTDKAGEPAAAELESYYKTVAMEYALPEYRTFSVLLLDKKGFGISDTASAADIRAWYDENKSDYAKAEQRVIAQIVAKDEDTAKAIYEAAKLSKDLVQASAEAVKGKKANYIKPATVAEADLPLEISTPAFKGAEDTVIEPVQSPLGWHVMHIQKVIAAATPAFEDVKADIEKELAQEKSAEKLYERANEVDDMVAGGKSLDEVAAAFGLKATRFENVDVAGKDMNGKAISTTMPLFDKAVENAFALDKGAVSQLIETPDGAFLLVETQDIAPAAPQPLDKVRSAVIKTWQEKRQGEILDAKAAKIMERLNLGESFDKVAADLKKKTESTGLLQRSAAAAPSAKLERGIIPALFSIEKTGQATSVGGKDSVLILRLASRKTELPKDVSTEDSAAMKNLLTRSLRNDLLGAYRNGLMSKNKVNINDQLIRDLYAPTDAGEE